MDNPPNGSNPDDAISTRRRRAQKNFVQKEKVRQNKENALRALTATLNIGASKKETKAHNQAIALKALRQSLGIVSRAARICGLSQDSIYKYIRDDEAFRNKWLAIIERKKDFVEERLFEAAEKENTAVLLFLGKHLLVGDVARGYGVPTNKLEHSGHVSHHIVGMLINNTGPSSQEGASTVCSGEQNFTQDGTDG